MRSRLPREKRAGRKGAHGPSKNKTMYPPPPVTSKHFHHSSGLEGPEWSGEITPTFRCICFPLKDRPSASLCDSLLKATTAHNVSCAVYYSQLCSYARSQRKGKGRQKEKESRGEAGEEEEEEEEVARRQPNDGGDGDAFMQKMRRQMMEKRKAVETSKGASGKDRGGVKGAGRGEEPVDEERDETDGAKGGDEGYAGGGEATGWRAGDSDDETDREKARRKAIKERAKEYEALREELKSKHRATRVMTGEERVKYDEVRGNAYL